MRDVNIVSEGQSLTFARLDDASDEKPDKLEVTLVGSGLRAQQVIDGGYLDFDALAAFFSEMSLAWTGWEGSRTYESLEHDLAMIATHDGHVRLEVCLKQIDADGWSARCVLRLEPGEQLSRVASEVSELVLGTR